MPGQADVQFIVDDQDVRRLLSNLQVSLMPTSLMRWLEHDFIPYLQHRAISRFANEGDAAVGGAWQALSQATQHIRSSQGYGAESPINVRTGELRDYVTKSQPLLVTMVSGASALYPGTVDTTGKFKTAQSGRTTAPITPARPVLGLDRADELIALEGLALYFAIGAAGGGEVSYGN